MLKDPSRSFRERVFILLTLVTDLVALFALAGDIYIGENMVEITALVFTLLIVPVITIVTVRLNKVNVAVRVIVIGLVFGLLPVLFYFGGGIQGGGVIWIIFAYLYTGLVLSGKWKPIMLVVLTCETVVFYMDEYIQPAAVEGSNLDKYRVDTMVSVILVGCVCCLMVWFVEWLFGEENKRAREEVKKYEELNKSQNRFFSSMSHEIRTPINSILGLNEIILRQDDASEEIRRDAGNIQGAGKMLLSLVNDILDVSKIEAGKMDIIPVNYSVSEFVSEIVNMMWLRAEQKGLELKIQIDPTIPQELFGDEVRIKQIVVNLLNNAVKYTREGTVTLHIAKEGIRNDSVLLVYSVSDTGMGIKEEALPYLFDAFQRADEEANRRIEGTGLGLSIVKQLVNLMNGEIAVNSVYGQGSTFMVSLWQKVSNPQPVGDISIKGYGKLVDEKRYVSGFLAPEASVLIVDDNEMNLEVERKLLQSTNIQVDTADGGEAALSMTAGKRYDIILMDHLMPEMDGIECLQRIRKQAAGLNNHAPIIALTANAGAENRQLYMTSGFDGYLLKPVSGLQLEEMLLTHLPESKVTRTVVAEQSRSQMNTARGYSKKVPVLIATSNLCDLPARILGELQIDTIPFRIHVDGKEYYDGLEAGTDEIIRYMKEGKEFRSEPPTVEEFEHFFAGEMKKAHQVIYITLAAGISKEYERAREASKNYGNVYVFNSGFNSSSIGLLVLMAHNMAMQGITPSSIINELGRQKSRVHCSFVASDPGVLYRRGIVGKSIYNIMKSVGLRLFFIIKDDMFRLDRIRLGDIDKCFYKYVDYALARHYKPDLDLVFVTYADVPEDMLEKIGERIRSRVSFKNIIFQKASGVVALSCGPGSYGIMYLEEGEHPYNLEKMIMPYMDAEADIPYENDDSEEDATYAGDAASGEHDVTGMDSPLDDTTESEQGDNDIKDEEGLWFSDIEGIDHKVGLENSGSEDSFKSVMKIFYDSIDLRADEIEGYYDSEDWENYTIKVHALKSSARLVGALKLSEDAEDLEMAGKENRIDFIRENTLDLLQQLRGFKEPLSELFGEASKMEPPEAESPKAEPAEEAQVKASLCEFDDFLMQSMYEALEQGIDQKNEALLAGTFKEMGDYQLPECCIETVEKLKEHFKNLDYEAMKKVLEERGKGHG
jgi:DegV family protein with EDD domain